MVYKKGAIPYIRFSDGFPTLNLLLNLDESLRYDVKTLLIRALASKNPESTKFIETASTSSDDTFVRVIAYPFNGLTGSPMLLLYFQELSSSDLQFNPGALTLPDESMMLKNLTSQLTTAREEIRLLSDELTINKETLQLMNEELQSSNEELQSSNEELETSNEELQSSNEELHVSLSHIENIQHQHALILNSTLDGILGFDMDMRHTFVNAAAAKMLGLSADELIGKKSNEFWQRTKSDGTAYLENECPLQNVLRLGKHHRGEEVFWRKDGTSFEVELVESPIIEGGKIIGAVISFHDITEQNRLEKIAIREHQLSDLYMSISGMLVMALDTNANILTINTEGCTILGLPSDQVIGKNWIDIFVPSESRDKFKEIFSSILSGEILIIPNNTFAVTDANNGRHLMSWTNAAIKDQEGNITGVICSAVDITKEDVLIQKLAQQENLYKLTFQEANIGIAHIGLDDSWIDANTYLCTLLGYTKEELLYMNLSDIIYPEDIAVDIHLKKLLLENQRNNYQVEKRYQHKNGNVIWVNHSAVLLHDEFGNPLYFLLIIRDISQLKFLMYELEMEKAERQNIIEYAPIPIMLHDDEGDIILTNFTLKECTGYSYKEIPTLDLWMDKLYPNISLPYKQELKLSYIQPIQGEPKEHHITVKTGENRVWLVSSVRLDHNHKNKPLIVSSAIDITEIQRKDEIMISQARQAAMGDMLAMIAHQWRQPLSIISMASNTLKAHLELDNEISDDVLEQVIETMDEQTHYLSRTIDDFRDFFKPDKVKDKVNMATIIEKLVTLIQKGLDNNGILLELPKNQEFEIHTYQNQLLQALINLINNAKDAIKEHNPTTGIIRIGLTREDREIIIQVCDNGGGISPSIKNTISQPYVTTKAENGTGLGLYMSNIIISKHLGGRLWWSSDSVGCCFYIGLPMILS
ncbi:MAG: PAS domain S-box protein [Sulfuricurvum sp.]|nr:PAS domain S-box protein [Sulfuricurvum sp.]